MTITLRYNESKNVYQATGEDAKKVWDALGFNDTFKIDDRSPVIVKPENINLFTTKMKETYNIEVLTA